MSELSRAGSEYPAALAEEQSRQFLGLMYEGESPELLACVPEEYLPTMFEILAQSELERIKEIKRINPKLRANMRGSVERMLRWAGGESYGQIAAGTDLSDERVRFALHTNAKALGERYDLDLLLKATEESIEQAVAASHKQAEEMAQLIAQEVEVQTAQDEVNELAAQPETTYEVLEVEELLPDESERLESEATQDYPDENGPVNQTMLEELARHFNQY